MTQTSGQNSTQHAGRARAHYRRHHRKADGRDLWLYGEAPHTGEPLGEFTDPIALGSVLRAHPLLGSYSIFSPHRQNRTFLPSAANDPLAPARPDGPVTEIPFTDFEVAIFGNRFPSLHPQAVTPKGEAWEEAQAQGACEVIVYTAEATGSMGTLSQARRLLLLEAILHRYEEHFARGAAFVLPFENRGAEIGATLPHPHGQIYAFPFVPGPQAAMARAFAGGYDLAADMRRWGAAFEISAHDKVRHVVPPFARFPYESWIVPERKVQGPWEMTASELGSLADVMGEAVRRYDALFSRPMPYMMHFEAAPFGKSEGWQFTVQFFPMLRDATRLKFLAGVEQSTGVFTVDVVPETAAQMLREAL